MAITGDAMSMRLLRWAALMVLFSQTASAEELKLLRLIPPAEVTYQGQAVGAMASPQVTVVWEGEVFWATEEGLYRRRPNGSLRRYDPRELTEGVMGHRLTVGAREDVSRKMWNLVLHDDVLWVASDAFGVFRFHPATERWARYDTTEQAVARKHLWIAYADPAYVFVMAASGAGVPALNVYSTHRQRWAALQWVPARHVRALGATPQEPWVATPVDYRGFLRHEVFEVPASLSAVISAEGAQYVYRDDTTQPKTRVELPKALIEELFSWREKSP